jgi:hypothetical protein
MRRISILTLLLSGAVLGAHVASSTTAQAEAKPVGDSATVTAAEPAGGYYAISSDLRRCATPLCGGWFLAQLNRSTTPCHDRRSAEQCYTPVLDWSSTTLSDEQQAELLEASRTSAASRQVYAIVRGSFAPTNSTTPQPELGRFVITEAWVAENTAPASGTFVWVHDNGLRCLIAPCRNLTERTLNTSRSTDIADIDFTPAALTDPEREVCTAAMYGPNGLVVAGQRYTVQANGNTAPGRTATAAYRRVDEPDILQ